MTSKKEKQSHTEGSKTNISEKNTEKQEADQELLEKINKRKEENLALKKLLENLKSI